VEEPHEGLIKQFVSQFPTAFIMALELAAANNYVACAIYEQSVCKRLFIADEGRGVVVDDGTKQPEEIQNPNSHRDWEAGAFSLSKRAFGVPLDKYKAENLNVEEMKGPGGFRLFLNSLLARRASVKART
jgi:hypothetical protein